MENLGLSRSIGNLKSKLDVRQYALEVALALPDEDKLKKAKEVEEYILDGVEVPEYVDPNAAINQLVKKATELSTSTASNNAENEIEKSEDNPM